jgi:hypothetical protein
MSCRIPYEKLKTLFDKSLQFDRDTYRFYRNSIASIMNLRNVDDEAKVHAIWFMGLSYNSALRIDDDIVTEGLPAKISELVYDKLTDPSADYKDLLKKINEILDAKVVISADLEGPIAQSPTADTKADIERKRQEELNSGRQEGNVYKYEAYDLSTESFKSTRTEPSKEIAEQKINAKYKAKLAALEGPKPEAPGTTTEPVKQLGLPTMLKPELRGKLIYATPGAGKSTFVKSNEGVIDSDQLIIEEMMKRHPDFKKEPKETDGNFIFRYVKEYDHKGEINQIVLGQIKELTDKGFTVLTGTRAFIDKADVIITVSPSNKRIISRFGKEEESQRFSVKEKEDIKAGTTVTPISLIDQNLEDFLLGKAPVKPAEKTTLQKINDILSKTSNTTKSNQILTLLNELQRILNQSKEYSNSQKVEVFKKFSEAIRDKKDSSAKATALAIIQTETDSLLGKGASTDFVDVSELDNLGKNVFVIRQADGNILETLFIDNKYYIIPEDYTQDMPIDALEEYKIKPRDYVVPFYDTTTNLYVVNNNGDLLRLDVNFAASGLDFANTIIRPAEGAVKGKSLDNRPGNQKIADNLTPGVGLQNQVRLVADKRRSLLNKRRIERLRALGYRINFENQLRKNQINYLLENPTKPVLSFLNSKSDVDLILSDLDGINWDYITGLDNLGFVYANGETRLVDWNDSQDLSLLKDLLRFKKWLPYTTEVRKFTYEYVVPTDTDLHNLKLAVQKLRDLKNTILDLMADDQTTLEVPADLYNQYIDIANVFKKYDFSDSRPENNLSSVKEKLLPTSSTIQTRIAKVLYGQVIASTIRTENVMGIIRKTADGIRFESSIEDGYTPIDEYDNPITFQQLFESQGVSIEDLFKNVNYERLKTYNHFYLVRMMNKWHTHPMVKVNYITDKTQVVDFLSVLSSAAYYRPEFLGDNAEEISAFIQTFNNSGWGFNVLSNSGLIANIEFLKMSTKGEPVFGIKFRATEEYALNEEFNDKKLSVQFKFNFDELQKNLNVLYNELGIKVKEYDSVESRIMLGQLLAEKLKKNKNSLSPEANAAIDTLNDFFKESVEDISSQMSKIIDKHADSVSKGKDVYIVNSTQFRNVIFGNNSTNQFKLRSKAESINPLLGYSVFGVKNTNNVLRLSVARPRVITGDTLVTNKPAPVGVRPTPKREDTLGSQPKIKKRVLSLVPSLIGLKRVSSPEIQSQIDDVLRFLGNHVEVKPEDLTDEDVTGFALGYYENKVIKLNSALNVSGVVYHEAFHAVFRLSLTAEQRAKYLALVRTIVGEPKETVDGRKYIRMRGENIYFDQFRKDRRYSGVDDAQIADYIYEEYLADGFRDYKLNNVEPKNKLLQYFYEFINKVINFFKGKAYRTAKNSIDRLYKSIDDGKYANVVGDEMLAPRAYELAFIPTSINENGDITTRQVDSYTNDQLVDRITREMLKRSYDIDKSSADSFKAIFDEVTEELIYYFRATNFIREDSPNRDKFISKYEPMFRAMRFMMGAAHRENILENFTLDNNSLNSRFDDFTFNDINDEDERLRLSTEAYTLVFKEVQRRFKDISVIEDETSAGEDENERETPSEIEDGNELDLADENNVGDSQYDDEGILTYKPYDGSKQFQKLIKYIMYEYEDTETGGKFHKMVNSKNIINIIRKITANVPKENLMAHIVDHLDYMRNHIDLFQKSKLENELGYIPSDMSTMIDKYNSLKAVFDTLSEQAGLDENLKPTRAVGEGFFNMFHNVFFYAQKEITAVSIDTSFESVEEDVKAESEETPIKNRFQVDNLIQKNDVNIITNNLATAARISLNTIYQDVLDKLLNELSLYKYNLPTTVKDFNAAVSYIYRLTSLGKLNIPINVIEFSIAADIRKQFKKLSTQDPNYRKQSALLSRVEKIVKPDQKFVDSDRYLNMPLFLRAYLNVFNNIGKSESVVENVIKALVKQYKPVALYHSKYEPGLSGTIVLNQDGKPISQFVPYVPSIQILTQLKEKGFEVALSDIHPLLQHWFANNPWIGTAVSNAPISKTAKTKEAIDNDTFNVFLNAMDVSIAGGLYQKYRGIYKKSTFKRIGEKGYMLSLLGLFSSRKTITGNYGQQIVLFERPITQLEATSTQFNVTGLYQNYTADTNLIINNFKKIIRQEFEEMRQEWLTRNEVKVRHEGYNIRTTEDGTRYTDLDSLRAYNFNYMKDFFEAEEGPTIDGVTASTRTSLRRALISAIKNDLSFEEALAQPFYDESGAKSRRTVDQVLSTEVLNYGEETVDNFFEYLNSIKIGYDDLPTSITTDKEKTRITRYTAVVKEATRNKDEEVDFIRNELATKTNKEEFVRDFVYNFLFNSLFVNQIFDGNIGVGIKSFIQYFKRQKSGVAAGNNNRNITIDEKDDVLTAGFFKQFNGYLNTENPSSPMTTEKGEGLTEFPIADGQAWSGIDRRIKNYIKDGILIKGSKLEKLIKKTRYAVLTEAELRFLEDNDIVLNSDKPAVAHPSYYLKDSEHYIDRCDVSYIEDPQTVARLYDELDAINFDNYSVDEEAESPIDKYERIIKEIHSYFKPKKGREILHFFLNSMEFHKVDIIFDDSVSKKGVVSPLILDLNLLAEGITEGHPVLTHAVLEDVPTVENGYINLSYNKTSIPSSFAYEQVKTGNIKGTNTDAIQKKLLLPAELDPKEFPEVTQIADKQNQIAKARMQFLQRIFKSSDVPTVVTKAIQAGLLKQGAGTNLLKYYAQDRELGKNEFNMNLPILGKTPMFYFFSIFNNNLFAPKVAGKKFYHVSSLGYQVVVDDNDNVIPRDLLDADPEKYKGYRTRYPTVKEVYDQDGNLKEIIIEVIIPKELASTPEEVKFFEKLYSKFLGARIPTEAHRSLVSAKVVDYISANYRNSIVVPAQVHKWAGSDLDIDSLYADVQDYYRTVNGELVKYGDYEIYQNKYGLTNSEAKFIEYLHYMSEDPAFQDLIQADINRQANSMGYRRLSLQNIAGNFGPHIRAMYEFNEYLVKGDLIQVQSALSLIEKMTAIVNVLQQFNLPNTKEDFYDFSIRSGTPVTPVLQNEILDLKLKLLSNPKVYERFIRNADSAKYINEYLTDRDYIESITKFKNLDKSNPFLPQTVGRIRALTSGGKGTLEANANQNKAAALMASSKVKLTDKYTFNFKYNGKTIDTRNSVNDAVEKVGGAISMSADDPTHQALGPLGISKINSSVVNAMYMFGYPPQFARLINSVKIFSDLINEYNIQNDPSYSRTGFFKISFGGFLNNELKYFISDYYDSLNDLGILQPTEAGAKTDFEINHDKIVISFNDIKSDAVISSNSPSDLNITVSVKRGRKLEALPQDLAQIVLLSFYNRMLAVGNATSFKVATLTNVYKQIRPSFDSLRRIKDSLSFIKNNEIFENATDILKDNPALSTLAEKAIPDMIDKSKQVLLDETNLFRGITSLFDNDRSVSKEVVVSELKSILALSTLSAFARNRVATNKATNKSQEDYTTEDVFLTYLVDALRSDYWLENTIKNDLIYLQQKFPENQFLNTLTLNPSDFGGKGSVEVVTSIAGDKVNPELQQALIDDFYQLVYDNDDSVYQTAIKLAIHGIVRDGAMSRSGGFLKVIAPELFKSTSDRLNELQFRLYSIDKQSSDNINEYLKGIDLLFEDLYFMGKSKILGVNSSNALGSILTKLVSVITKNSESSPSIRMSFYKPGKNSKYSPGKFADIDLKLFRSLVDEMLPKNYNFIYSYNTETDKTIPATNLVLTDKGKNTKFEFWKGDENGELYFDLSTIPLDFKEEADRMLKSQGVYPVKNEQYGFPLYQINSFEGGQLFMLTELDGKPFNVEFFSNMFRAYQETDEATFLLRGKTAKYKIVSRQGVDRILPNAFTNETGTAIRSAVLGAKSTTSFTSVPSLPAGVKVIKESGHIQLNNRQSAVSMIGKNFMLVNKKIAVATAIEEYSVNKRSKQLLLNNKLLTTDQMRLFANKLGFASFEEMQNDAEMKEWLSGTKDSKSMYIIPYTLQEMTAVDNTVQTTAEPLIEFEQTSIVQDNNSYYRGQLRPFKLDSKGNLILEPQIANWQAEISYDKYKGMGISMSPDLSVASAQGNMFYQGELERPITDGFLDEADAEAFIERVTEEGYYVVQLDKKYIRDNFKDIFDNKEYEQRIGTSKSITIPKGKFKIENVRPDIEQTRTAKLRDGKSYSIDQINRNMLSEMGYTPIQIGEILSKLC